MNWTRRWFDCVWRPPFFWVFFSAYAQLWGQTSVHMWFSPNAVAAAMAVPSFPLLLWKWIPGNPWIPRLHVPTCPALCLNCRFFTQTHGALLARAHGRTSPGGLILRFGDKMFTLSWLQNNWLQILGGSENSWRAAPGPFRGNLLSFCSCILNGKRRNRDQDQSLIITFLRRELQCFRLPVDAWLLVAATCRLRRRDQPH